MEIVTSFHSEEVFLNEQFSQQPFIVISGPSAGGKTSLAKEVATTFSNDIALLIKHTDRLPRPGEVEGKDYYFHSPEEFDTQISRTHPIIIVNRYGHHYALGAKEVAEAIRNKKRPTFILDPHAALKFKKVYRFSSLFFVAPESLYEVKNRILARNESIAEIEKRLIMLEEEYALRKGFDYNSYSDEGLIVFSQILSRKQEVLSI